MAFNTTAIMAQDKIEGFRIAYQYATLEGSAHVTPTQTKLFESSCTIASSIGVSEWMKSGHALYPTAWIERLKRSRYLKTSRNLLVLFWLPDEAVLQLVHTNDGRILYHLETLKQRADYGSIVTALLNAVIIPYIQSWPLGDEDRATLANEPAQGFDRERYFLRYHHALHSLLLADESLVEASYAAALDAPHDAADDPSNVLGSIDHALLLESMLVDYHRHRLSAKQGVAPIQNLETSVIMGELARLVASNPKFLLVPETSMMRLQEDAFLYRIRLQARRVHNHGGTLIVPLNGSGHWTVLFYSGDYNYALHLDSLVGRPDGYSSHANMVAILYRVLREELPGLAAPMMGWFPAHSLQHAMECGTYPIGAVVALVELGTDEFFANEGQRFRDTARSFITSHIMNTMDGYWKQPEEASDLRYQVYRTLRQQVLQLVSD